MSETEVRPTAAEDFAPLSQALAQVHAADGYPVEGVDDAQAWITLPDALGQWTGLLNAKPVAHVALLRPGPGDAAPDLFASRMGGARSEVAVLARLFVAPSARGRSLANALMAVAERAAEDLGLHPVLDVMAKDVHAIRLYESRGWRVLGEFWHDYGDGHRARACAFAGPG